MIRSFAQAGDTTSYLHFSKNILYVLSCARLRICTPNSVSDLRNSISVVNQLCDTALALDCSPWVLQEQSGSAPTVGFHLRLVHLNCLDPRSQPPDLNCASYTILPIPLFTSSSTLSLFRPGQHTPLLTLSELVVDCTGRAREIDSVDRCTSATLKATIGRQRLHNGEHHITRRMRTFDEERAIPKISRLTPSSAYAFLPRIVLPYHRWMYVKDSY